MQTNHRNNMLIIGAGYLGTHIAHYFNDQHEVNLIDKPDIDITSLQSIESVLKLHKPNIVINAAAIADTHFAEKPENRDLTFKVNVQGPLNLAYFTNAHHYRLVHISTGMMFSGHEGEIATEVSQAHPSSYYAWTKAWADAALLPFCQQNQILITRIQLPIAADQHSRNLLTKLPQFQSYLDAPRSFTVISDYLQALEYLIQNHQSGIFNVVCDDTISFLEIARLMQDQGLIDRQKTLQAISYPELVRITQEKGGAVPTDTVLNNTKLKEVGVTTRSIKEAILDTITQLKGEHK